MKPYRFVHLNVHSHYSINAGIASIRELVDAAIKERMPGIAITDTGNMFGIMEFFDYVSRINIERQEKGQKPFKPIIGCELYVAKNGSKNKKDGHKDWKGFHLTVLAKNLTGYKNLMKIVSNAWTDGFCMSPRTDRADLEKYHEGLIVLSGSFGSEVFTKISKGDIEGLEETIRWYQQTFGEDYYLELNRCADYDLKSNKPSYLMLEQQKVNAVLIQKAKEYGVKVVATNDVRYVAPEDLAVFKIQLCYATGKTMEESALKDLLLFSWLTSRKFMCELFSDVPEAIANTMEILDKVEFYDIHHSPIIPTIDIPNGFGNDIISKEDAYLEYLSFSKAKQIYGESLPEDVSDRLKFELQIIKQRAASGYFLFLQDVVNTAQSELGVWVGPGRGSAAGSLVCYCLGITKIDPLKHDLLFERFLSPKDTAFPDIDIDFDDEGRERVIEWLKQKYGKECCAHIVCFSKNTMDMGVHACGIVVSDGPITDFAPVCVLNNPDKEGETVRCTKYDGWHVESTGLVRFDFIGQKVLSQQKAICEYIKSIKGINIDLNKIPLDDSKTFKLFQKEKTEGVFCFDVDGMRQWLHYLHPTKFNDLVILNVMYRPEIEYYIPQMLQRKNGKEKIEYPIPAMEKYLHETYGMVIYQEQIMFLCRLLADFTRAESDMLRKALGRKKTDELSELKAKFIKGGLRNGHKKAALEKIWKEWEEKGKYAINKAHVVCLTWLAYQMAYLKAHYPEEFKQVIDKDNLY